MVDGPAAPAPARVRRLEPQGAAVDAAVLSRVASLHRACLPWTASSRAGAVAAMYECLLHDPAAVVLAAMGEGGQGGFASGSLDLRATSARVKRHLLGHPATFARLVALNLLSPGHLLAARAWDRVIPREAVGYVLTIGATPGSPVRGAEVLRALEAEFAARGARESWVDTEQANARAVEFYRRKGYEVASARFGQVLLRRPLAATR